MTVHRQTRLLTGALTQLGGDSVIRETKRERINAREVVTLAAALYRPPRIEGRATPTSLHLDAEYARALIAPV